MRRVLRAAPLACSPEYIYLYINIDIHQYDLYISIHIYHIYLYIETYCANREALSSARRSAGM